MAERSIIDQLDDAVSALLAKPPVDWSVDDPTVASLVAVAGELRGLPRENFRAQLRSEFPTNKELPMEVMTKEQPVFAPYITVDDAAAAIEFYKNAFGATELMRLAEPGGKIGHAELRIGSTVFMLADEYPDYKAFSPKTLGGSPVKMHLYVENADRFVERAVQAGAEILRPVADQFYGDRAGQIVDPFGFTWIVATHTEDVSTEEMERRMNNVIEGDLKKEESHKHGPPEGFHSVTPYITVQQPAELIDFLTKAFGAEEKFRTTGSAGGMHAEVRIGDSMVMIGGAPHIPAMPTAVHLYIPDVDEVYQRAIEAGATSLMTPEDQPYGERSGGVEDLGGNRWYIATPFVPLTDIAKDLRTVTVYFHPIGAQKFIDFVTDAFGATELMRHAEEDMIMHAKVQIGDSVIELGEARTPTQPLPTAIYLYVDDVDAMYERALKAGGVSMLAPTNQDYGDRNAWVKDPFDNVWYIAAPKSS
ncbi:MAG TPA: VOC family protein [Pyrinomonadaceae bacterium]